MRKHRGRVVTIVGFDDRRDFAEVRFDDTPGSGSAKIPCEQLAEVGTPTDVPNRLPSLEELRSHSERLALRLAAEPTSSRMSEFRTLSAQLGRATTKANMRETANCMGLLLAAAAKGIARVEGRDFDVVLKEMTAELARGPSGWAPAPQPFEGVTDFSTAMELAPSVGFSDGVTVAESLTTDALRQVLLNTGTTCHLQGFRGAWLAAPFKGPIDSGEWGSVMGKYERSFRRALRAEGKRRGL